VHVFFGPGYTTSSTVAVGAPAGGALQFYGFEVLGADLGGGIASVIVGAPAVGATTSKVYVHAWSAGVLGLAYTLTNPTLAGGEYGRALAAGNVDSGSAAVELIVGDRSFAAFPASNRGRVYLYAGTLLTSYLDSPAPVDNGFFGSALAAGDLTGDGVADLAVGAPGEGKVYLYAGSATGPVAPPVVLDYPGPSIAVGFGTALLCGDANGDGAPDLVVGHLPAGGVGEAFVFLGTPGGGNSFQLRAQLQDADSFANLYGTAFAIGDTDGDGTPELFGGAPTKYVGFLEQGLVFQGRL
jgi:hypothetical protein